MADAKAWIIAASDSDIVKPWDQKGYKLPGGAPYTPSGFMTFVGASAMVNGKTMGAYPATKALMSAVYEGSLVPFDTALRIEARWFTNIVMNPSSSAMIRSLFISKGALEKGAVRPKNVPDQSVRIIGILGAGMMGAGIALVAAQAGIEVVLVDQDQNAANKGKEYSEKYLTDGIKRGKISEKIKEETLNRILATDDYTKLADADLVIEAVFEDTKVKSDVTKAAVEVIHKDCIFASTPSTLPLSELAKASKHPENYIGIHFFSPVDKMNLVELIKSETTNDNALAVALDYTSLIKKTPIVVNDSRGFYANRCIIPYINEGLRMLSEGIEPALIENSAKQIGMPVGPLQLLDELSVSLALNVAKETKEALGTKYEETGTESILLEMSQKNRLGRKELAGFYEYDEKGRRLALWEGLKNLNIEKTSADIPTETVKNRLEYVQAIEASRAFEEKILLSVDEGDVGGILGWGCLIWAGGPFSWLDNIGHKKVVAECQDLSDQYGARFAPPKIIRELANSGRKFYN